MKIFKIEENDAFSRLDKFLKKLFSNATRSLIYKLNRKEKIKIKSSDTNGKFKKKDNEYKLQVGDEVKVFLSDEDLKKLCELKTSYNSSLSGRGIESFLYDKVKEDCSIFPPNKGGSIKKDIVYEDGSLLVLNKSAGINVHPGDYKTKEISLIQQIHDYLGNKYDSLTFRPSLVHRIDRDTSGILLIAKKKNILQKLVNDFKNHKNVKKIYYAIVSGKILEKEGTITKKLERIKDFQVNSSLMERGKSLKGHKVLISKNGREAITNYKVLDEFNLKTKEGNLIFSELEIEIETGRMHQIRVHLANLGNPILGDKIYGDKKLNTFLERNYGLKRQALHAWKIEFFHYGKNEKLNLEARIKEDLKEFLKKVKLIKG